MLKIRLQRTGRKNDPAFRMVVAEHSIGAKSGKIVEKVGSHHPKMKNTVIDSERIKYWMSVGAKASDRVHNMLISEGIIEGKKVNVLPKKTPVVKEEKSKEETAAEAPESEEAAAEEGREETPKEEKTEETPAEEEKTGGTSEEEAEEKPAEATPKEGAEEKTEEAPAEEEKKD